jgi:hypothetical protein
MSVYTLDPDSFALIQTLRGVATNVLRVCAQAALREPEVAVVVAPAATGTD